VSSITPILPVFDRGVFALLVAMTGNEYIFYILGIYCLKTTLKCVKDQCFSASNGTDAAAAAVPSTAVAEAPVTTQVMDERVGLLVQSYITQRQDELDELNAAALQIMAPDNESLNGQLKQLAREWSPKLLSITQMVSSYCGSPIDKDATISVLLRTSELLNATYTVENWKIRRKDLVKAVGDLHTQLVKMKISFDVEA